MEAPGPSGWSVISDGAIAPQPASSPTTPASTAFNAEALVSMGLQFAAFGSLIWCFFVLMLQVTGSVQIFRHWSKRPAAPYSPTLPAEKAPHVTLIRPVKGVEHELYNCMASTFRQNYPRDRLSIRLCVSDRDDPAYPVLLKLVEDFPEHDAQVLVETDDAVLADMNLGPNPKIRNVSRAYRESKGDIIWIVDCNVWVDRNTVGRMVDKLVGWNADGSKAKPHGLVHQLPLIVDLHDSESPDYNALQYGGGRLDEMFFASCHDKYYAAFAAINVAPCVLGKSNMFRKSHLDAATNPDLNPLAERSRENETQLIGTDYFSPHICEDHCISSALWNYPLPDYNKIGLMPGEFAIQPLNNMSVESFLSRRIRWLRARKWIVLLAGWVEPGIEPFLCAIWAAIAGTCLPWLPEALGIPRTLGAATAIWFTVVAVWAVSDYVTFLALHSGATVEVDEHTPAYARGDLGRSRSIGELFLAWLVREAVAVPIWAWAYFRPTVIRWRGRTFRISSDQKVVEILPKKAI